MTDPTGGTRGEDSRRTSDSCLDEAATCTHGDDVRLHLQQATVEDSALRETCQEELILGGLAGEQRWPGDFQPADEVFTGSQTHSLLLKRVKRTSITARNICERIMFLSLTDGLVGGVASLQRGWQRPSHYSDPRTPKCSSIKVCRERPDNYLGFAVLIIKTMPFGGGALT